jgi:hypothetical protein
MKFHNEGFHNLQMCTPTSQFEFFKVLVYADDNNGDESGMTCSTNEEMICSYKIWIAVF